VIISCKSIGNYCSANGGVIVGNKGSNDNIATIGNYVKLSIGCKVYDKITIGDHIILASNSVVFKVVPSNVAVSGVPAKIIKIGIFVDFTYYFDNNKQ
jgi:serine O-acetyltransferase